MATPHRIDTHPHILPPDYAAWLKRKSADAGGLPIPDWSVDLALASMEARSVRTSIVSVSTPGVHFGDTAEARAMARSVNEYAADVAKRNPGRFGFFATVTLPDVEGSLAELAHAFDTLHADGVVLLANTHGTYLGDEAQQPLFDELNRRNAVVFDPPGATAGTAGSRCARLRGRLPARHDARRGASDDVGHHGALSEHQGDSVARRRLRAVCIAPHRDHHVDRQRR